MFDILFLLIVGLSTAFAVLRGGLQELSTLLALGLAAGLAWLTAPPLLGLLGLSGSFFGAIIVAAGLIGVFFVGAHIGFHLLLKRLPMNTQTRLFNQIGGGLFGAARGLVLIGLGYLGYSYYLDEARQPDSVKNAITQPIAAGLAGWFEGFAPASTELEGIGAETTEQEGDAAQAGYDRADRSGLNEIVTTVTTTGEDPQTPEPESDIDIADLLTGEDQ